MELEDFLNRHIIITLKDGEEVEGILMEVKDQDDDINAIYYTTLTLRIDLDDYRVIYLTEIESVSVVGE